MWKWILGTWSNMHVLQHTLSIGFTIHHCSSCNARVLKLRGLVKKIEEFVTGEDAGTYSACRNPKTLQGAKHN